MAPKNNSSSQRATAKKQASISSFFAVKPTLLQKQPSQNLQRDLAGNDARPSLSATPDLVDRLANAVSSSDDDLTKRGFRKRPSTASGSNAENEDPVVRKRRRVVVQDEDDDDDNDDDLYGGGLLNNVTTKSPTTAPVQPTGTSARARQPLSSRTSKYLFRETSATDLASDDAAEVETDEMRQSKERLHQRFLKKLGRPDSIAEIKRRNHVIAPDQNDGVDEPNEEGEDDEEPQPKHAKVKLKGGARANGKLTPMEQQYMEIKLKHLTTLIVYQVGYKYRIFGEDARISAKELGLVCIPGKFRYDNHASESHIDRFAACSFPLFRLHVHVKRLVQAGHKVGVVKQLETAALKAIGDNRNTPFVRKLTNVYTKGTYIDDIEALDSAHESVSGDTTSTGHLLCLTETNANTTGNDEKVHIGLIAVQPSTGSIIYDDFEDGFMRSELETRLLHIAPCEYLIVGRLSSPTEKLISHLSASKSNVFGDKARVERIEKAKTIAAESYSHVTTFYAEQLKDGDGDASVDARHHSVERINQLTEHVTICLSSMIKHLGEYGLEHVFDLTKNFQSFSVKTHMLLNGNTLNSLEIYQNQTDFTERGSLLWCLDRTRTRFGKRLLRNWVGRPLLDTNKLNNRTSAIGELLQIEKTQATEHLRKIVSSIKGDLEKTLTRIYYRRAARPELVTFLQTLQRVANEFALNSDHATFSSDLLRTSIAAIPGIACRMIDFLERINMQAAKEDDKPNFFLSQHETEDIRRHSVGIVAIEHDLDEHRKSVARILGRKSIEYVTVALNEYLVEVPNDKPSLSKVPASWMKISGTKKMSRFHTPEIVKLLRERDQHKEALETACDDAFEELLTEISSHYQELRDAIQAVALIDCLLSLADVAAQPDYVKPIYSETPAINITQGRHPMIEQITTGAYIPNNCNLSNSVESDDASSLLITGPNMGGKSSFVRSIALIAIMSQIGSFVPAERVELSMLDAVFTRMGAFDNMMRGESTFMVELNETSDILKQATPRSLVILDELGRGTSTHDGVAIAEAVLREMTERNIMTLFITHYQDLARLASQCNGLRNVHMRFAESGKENEEEITFLYEVCDGVAHRSYGLNVARLAHLPKGLIDIAAVKSKELENSIEGRKLRRIASMMKEICDDAAQPDIDKLIQDIEQL